VILATLMILAILVILWYLQVSEMTHSGFIAFVCERVHGYTRLTVPWLLRPIHLRPGTPERWYGSGAEKKLRTMQTYEKKIATNYQARN